MNGDPPAAVLLAAGSQAVRPASLILLQGFRRGACLAEAPARIPDIRKLGASDSFCRLGVKSARNG